MHGKSKGAITCAKPKPAQAVGGGKKTKGTRKGY